MDGPCEHQEGHVAVRNRIFYDFVMILAPHLDSFSGTGGSNSGLFPGLVPRLLLIVILESQCGQQGSENQAFVRKIKKNSFSQKSFF